MEEHKDKNTKHKHTHTYVCCTYIHIFWLHFSSFVLKLDVCLVSLSKVKPLTSAMDVGC